MLLSTSNLAKFYGDRQVLKDVSLSLYPGDHVGLVGANGAGKSTLIKILAGDITADIGAIQRASDLEIGYLPQALLDIEGKRVDDLIRESLGSLHALEARLRELERRMTQDDANMDTVLSAYAETTERFERRGGYEIGHQLEIVLAGLEGVVGEMLDEDWRDCLGNLADAEAEQDYTLRVRAVDAAGNISQYSDPITFQLGYQPGCLCSDSQVGAGAGFAPLVLAGLLLLRPRRRTGGN